MARRPITGWTPQDEAKLRTLKAKRVRERDIALQLGRTPRSIKCKWRDLRRGGSSEAIVLAQWKPRPEPKARQNDCAGHVTRVLEQLPHGFPFYDLRAQFRVAA